MRVCWKEEDNRGKKEKHTHTIFCERRCGGEIGKAENEKDLSLADKREQMSGG